MTLNVTAQTDDRIRILMYTYTGANGLDIPLHYSHLSTHLLNVEFVLLVPWLLFMYESLLYSCRIVSFHKIQKCPRPPVDKWTVNGKWTEFI